MVRFSYLRCKRGQFHCPAQWLEVPAWFQMMVTTECPGLLQLAQRKIQEILAQVQRQQQTKPSSGSQTPLPTRRKWDCGATWSHRQAGEYVRGLDRLTGDGSSAWSSRRRNTRENTRLRFFFFSPLWGGKSMKEKAASQGVKGCGNLYLSILPSGGWVENRPPVDATLPPLSSAPSISFWECTAEGSQWIHTHTHIYARALLFLTTWVCPLFISH